MGLEQMQAHCYRCGRPTLHARHVHRCPHMAYLLLTIVFLCFWGFGLIFLPIWLIHALCVGSDPPFLCSQCGQMLNQLTPEQEQLDTIERAKTAARKAAYGHELMIRNSALAQQNERSAASEWQNFVAEQSRTSMTESEGLMEP